MAGGTKIEGRAVTKLKATARDCTSYRSLQLSYPFKMANVVPTTTLQITPREAHNLIRHIRRYVEDVLEDPCNSAGPASIQTFYFKHILNCADRAWVRRVMQKLDTEITDLNPNLNLSYDLDIEHGFYVGRRRETTLINNAVTFYIDTVWDHDAETVLDALREFDTYEPDLLAPDDGYTDGTVQYPGMQALVDARIARRRAGAGTDARIVPVPDSDSDSDSDSEEEAEPVRQLPPVARRIHPAEPKPAEDEDPSSEDA